MNQTRLDTLFVNGKIYTLREKSDFAEALGIKNGRIQFIGSNREAELLAAEKTIDLEGKTLIPGMGDSHLHLFAYCKNQTAVNLENVRSIDELLAVMRKKAASTPKGKWIKGAGFDQTKFIENRMPTREDLDKISTDHPIVIRRCCLHTMIANSPAILLAGVDRAMAVQSDGLIEVDENKVPTGVFHEKSTIVFDEIVPDILADPAEKRKILLEVLGDMVSKGITSINTYAAKIWNYEEDILTYRELEEEGLLPLRVIVSLDTLFENEVLSQSSLQKDPFAKVKYGSYKLFTDGSLGAKSAALQEPYSDDSGNCGILVDKDKLYHDLYTAYGKGLQPAIHAIGDRALEITLDTIEAVLKNSGGSVQPGGDKRLPFRIIHAQLVTPAQLERMKKLPIILDIQPVFLCTDLYWIESSIGNKRIKNAYLWKSMSDAGLMMAGGSDCPVESYDPIKGIYAAVTRQDINGFPSGGWEPDEKLSVYEALCLFTKNIAYTTGDEDVLGTIEKNKFADLVVLDHDPFTVTAEELKEIKVLKTFVAGEMVFDRKQAAHTAKMMVYCS